MNKRIVTYVLAVIILFSGMSCMKEKVVDDFQQFGQFSIDNATTYNNLFARVDTIEYQLTNGLYFNLKPGPNRLIISGRGGRPADKPVVIFDTLLTIEANQKYVFSLFQPVADMRPVVIVNDQGNESAPEKGRVKIKIANYAKKCLPDLIDVEMIMSDYNFNIIPTDTIRQVVRDFSGYGNFQLIDAGIAASGTVFFTPLDPNTKEPLCETLYGLELDDYATSSWFKVVTLFITEELSEYGNVIGSDGNKYSVQVKTMFIN